jgi:hypothetical protein
MRSIVFSLIFVSLVIVSGCSTAPKKQADADTAKKIAVEGGKSRARKSPPEKIIVTPSNSLFGTIVRVNAISRYAILSFPTFTLPSKDSHVSAYRKGLKVAELKVTGPQEGDNTVADIVQGEVIIGDEIRGN